MKSIKIAVIAVSAFPFVCAPLFGGMIMNMENAVKFKGETNRSSMVHYIEPEFSRLEMSVEYQDPAKKGRSTQRSVVITRLDKKVLWMLIPARSGYCEFTFDELRRSMKSGSSLVPAGTSSSGFKYEKTSKSRKIAGFKADEYAISGKNLKGKAWVSEDKKLKAAAEFNRKQAALLGGAAGKTPGSSGVLMGYESDSDGASQRMTVKSVKFSEIAGSSFDIPKGYSRLKSAEWTNYQKNFDSRMIMDQLKKELKESAKKQAAEKGKDAAKEGLKGLLGF